MFLKLALAAVIILVTFVAMVRIQRHLKGDDGGSWFGNKPRRDEPQGPNELEQFIQAYRREQGGPGDPSAPSPAAQPAPALSADSVHAASAASSAPAAPRAHPAFLVGPKKLMYLVLKSALPDHHVFANCCVADLLELRPGAPPALRQARADFVVCHRDLRVVAVVDVMAPGAPSDALKQAVQEQLSAAAIHYLRVQPPALPKPAQVRALIYPA
jgi:hypothetical protein